MFKDYKYIEFEKANSYLETKKIPFVCFDDKLVFGEYPEVKECFHDNDQDSRRTEIKKDIHKCVNSIREEIE